VSNKTNTNYYWSEEIGQLVKEKKEKYLKWIRSKCPQDRTEFKTLQRKMRRMVLGEENESWENTCLLVESYLGGKRSTEAWRIMKNLRKNENKDNVLTQYPLTNGKHILKNF
jgi:hypothetical protein